MPWWWVWWQRGALAHLSAATLLSLPAKPCCLLKFLSAHFWSVINVVSSNVGGVRRRKRNAVLPVATPVPTARIIHNSLFVQCCHLFSPSFLSYYSDFTMLVWIMWIFTLCFDWNSRTWFRKWREGGGRTLRASSLITSLQVGGFICWTGFDSLHPPHAFA